MKEEEMKSRVEPVTRSGFPGASRRVLKFRGMDAFRPGTWLFSEGDLAGFFYGVSDGQFLGETLGQFTGLKDKNGRDIYEGDIVRHPTDGVFQIQFHLDRFEAIRERPIGPDARNLWSASNIVWVIGNIYENPEIMEKKP